MWHTFYLTEDSVIQWLLPELSCFYVPWYLMRPSQHWYGHPSMLKPQNVNVTVSSYIGLPRHLSACFEIWLNCAGLLQNFPCKMMQYTQNLHNCAHSPIMKFANLGLPVITDHLSHYPRIPMPWQPHSIVTEIGVNGPMIGKVTAISFLSMWAKSANCSLYFSELQSRMCSLKGKNSRLLLLIFHLFSHVIPIWKVKSMACFCQKKFRKLVLC